MAKKKERKIFNIDEVNIEIDYDKLAEAIVKANETQTNQYSVSREWMKFIIFPVFCGVSAITGFFAVVCIIYGAGELNGLLSSSALVGFDWKQGSLGIIAICIGLFFISISLITFFTGKEIDKEKDRNYVASMFSNVVALVALIVSLVALVKG